MSRSPGKRSHHGRSQQSWRRRVSSDPQEKQGSEASTMQTIVWTLPCRFEKDCTRATSNTRHTGPQPRKQASASSPHFLRSPSHLASSAWSPGWRMFLQHSATLSETLRSEKHCHKAVVLTAASPPGVAPGPSPCAARSDRKMCGQFRTAQVRAARGHAVTSVHSVSLPHSTRHQMQTHSHTAQTQCSEASAQGGRVRLRRSVASGRT